MCVCVRACACITCALAGGEGAGGGRMRAPACTYDDKHARTTPTRTCTGAAALAPLLGDANCRMTALDLRSINCGAQGAATATLSSALAANQTQH